MGYYSTYNLTLQPHDESIILELRESNDDAKCALEEDGGCGQSAKWYDSEDDLTEFSKKYPTTLFALYRQGEDPEDIECCYFKNGQSQNAHATITYDKCIL